MINEGNLVETIEQLDNDNIDYWREADEEPVYYNDDVSISTVSTHDTEANKNKVKTRFGESYKNDKHYFKIKGNKKGIPSITGFSTSVLPGATIRNGVTGYLECDYMGKPIYKVGSLNEELFFKANVSVNGITGEPRILFYDSPEQYERHFRTTLSDETKNIWREKYKTRVVINEKNKKPEVSYHEIR